MSLSSDFIKNTEAIVSADVSDIKLSKEFIDDYGIEEKQFKYLEASLHTNMGMTEYQCQHFVTDVQLTPWRKVRQALMELETRYHAYHEISHSLKKADLLRRKWLHQLEQESDLFEKERISLDLDKNDYDITIWKRKLKQSQEEIKIYLDIIDQYVDEDHPLEYYTNNNESEERIYWIARMGKQAAMDIISYGRIGTGNMTSIMDMPDEDQLLTLESAIKYSGMIAGGMDKINTLMQPELQMQLKSAGINLPKLDIVTKYTGQFKLKSGEEK